MEHQGEYLRQGATSSDMGMDAHMQMMERRHLATLWCHFVNVLLGFWVLSAPFIFGYMNVAPGDLDLPRLAAERNLPEVATRALLMTWNDVISGALIVLFAILSLKRISWAQWANTVMGLWLMFAPLLFWTPSPASYGNALLVGGLVIAFSTLVPMMPGMSMQGMMQKAAVPPGWDYNPSTWLQRLPIAILAVIGILLARYLAAYQLGHTSNAWDPFFGTEPNGTETIITSDMSRAWPVSDAGIGVMAYMIELFFIIAQPIFIDTWCTLCLVQALAMLVMMPYALDELVAMGQFLKDARRRGKPFWKTFFMGDAMEGAREDNTPEFDGSLSSMTLKGLRGVNLPWGLALLCILGVWLMSTRLIFGTDGAMANSDHLMGSLLITVSVLAFAEVARPLRFLNLPIGAWLIAAPSFLDGAGFAATIGSLIAGLLVIVLSLPKGVINHRYAGWNALLR